MLVCLMVYRVEAWHVPLSVFGASWFDQVGVTGNCTHLGGSGVLHCLLGMCSLYFLK